MAAIDEEARRRIGVADDQVVEAVAIQIATTGDSEAELLMGRVARMQQAILTDIVRTIIDHDRAFIGMALNPGEVPGMDEV